MPNPWNLHSRSSKVLDSGTIPYIMYNFMLVCRCKYSCIMYQLELFDIQQYYDFEI